MEIANKGLSRRRFLWLTAAGLTGGGATFLFPACNPTEPKVRIASNVWPGYELLYLARDLGKFDSNSIKLIEVPSSQVAIQSLATGAVEGAMLTLDEVLTARAEGVDLRVVLVLDISLGADALVARPTISSLKGLRGKRVGVENSAVGAVMLAAALEKSGMTRADVQSVYMTVNRHVEAYRAGAVDAVVTFEPAKTQLIKAGARNLFDSAQIPGRIVDVLAVLPGALRASRKTLKTLVRAQFAGLAYLKSNADAAAQLLSKRLQIDPSQVPDAYVGVDLPDLSRNIELMTGPEPKILRSTRELARVMIEANLLPRAAVLDDLLDTSLLEI